MAPGCLALRAASGVEPVAVENVLGAQRTDLIKSHPNLIRTAIENSSLVTVARRDSVEAVHRPEPAMIYAAFLRFAESAHVLPFLCLRQVIAELLEPPTVDDLEDTICWASAI